MEKIALITDSACDIDDETIKKYNVHMLPFKIIYKDREYTDKVDITPQEVYENMDNEIPTSSLPSMADMHTLFEKLREEKYTHVISINISSGISGTVNAINIVSKEYPELTTYIHDTKSTSIVEGIIVKKCGELISKGNSFGEITEQIPKMKDKLKFIFVFGTLEYAIKGGRIGKVSGTIGNFLDIKPLVGFDCENGKCFNSEKIRGRNKALDRLVEIGEEFSGAEECEAYVIHGNVEADAKKMCDKLKKNPKIKKVSLIGQISAIVGVYCGPGTIGVCYSKL